MTDRRITAANARVAHVSLRGAVRADRFVEGEWRRVTAPLADLVATADGPRDRQVLLGERLLTLEDREGWAFVRAEKDGYCGYLRASATGPDRAATHWLAVPGSHLYSGNNLKTPEIASLSFGARLTVVKEHARFLETADGHFVPRPHLRPVGAWLDDPAGVAELFLGTPYLWGGNSRSGIDCSGLVQASLLACGIACPGDTDLQQASVGAEISRSGPFRRGDLLFWRGHVAMAVSPDRMVHANGFRMAVTHEGISEAIARIEAQGEGPLVCARRP